MANLLNIVGNIICLLLDSCGIGPGLGWQALLSATFITLVAAGASTIGGLIGFRSRSGHSSLEMFENSIELKAVTGSAWPSK
jgi:hypothetical protein